MPNEHHDKVGYHIVIQYYVEGLVCISMGASVSFQNIQTSGFQTFSYNVVKIGVSLISVIIAQQTWHRG